MNRRIRAACQSTFLTAGIGATLLSLPGSALAGFINCSTGNQQYADVIVALDNDAVTILGKVSGTTVNLGQHDPLNTMRVMYLLSLTDDAGTV